MIKNFAFGPAGAIIDEPLVAVEAQLRSIVDANGEPGVIKSVWRLGKEARMPTGDELILAQLSIRGLRYDSTSYPATFDHARCTLRVRLYWEDQSEERDANALSLTSWVLSWLQGSTSGTTDSTGIAVSSNWDIDFQSNSVSVGVDDYFETNDGVVRASFPYRAAYIDIPVVLYNLHIR